MVGLFRGLQNNGISVCGKNSYVEPAYSLEALNAITTRHRLTKLQGEAHTIDNLYIS